jgi:hypothetical protein
MLDNNIREYGKNNFVDPSATNVLIVGNGNKVLGKISNIHIVGDNQTITESDTFSVDGFIQINNTRARGNRVVRTAEATVTVDIGVLQYIVDTSANDVVIDLDAIINTGEIYPDYVLNLKKLVQSNKITFALGTATIDGIANPKIKNKDTNIKLRYEGFDRFYRV